MPNAILVTGGAGLIGSHTVDLLVQRGETVRVLDSLVSRVHPHGRPSYIADEIEFIHADVSDMAVLRRALKGVNRVVHLAAYQDYLPDFSSFIHQNAESAAALYEIVVEEKLPIEKILFASSQAVAGEGLYECIEHGQVVPPQRALSQLLRGDWELHCPKCGRYMSALPIPEWVAQPHTAYAISKYAVELLAESLGCRYGISSVCARYTYVQGSRNSLYNAYSGVARRFALSILSNHRPVCYEDGLQLRDYINVIDVARANILLLDHPESDAAYNVGGPVPMTVYDFALLMIEAFGSSLTPLVSGEFRMGDTRHTVSDTSRLRALGWEPHFTPVDTVQEYVTWCHENEVHPHTLENADAVMRALGILRMTSR